LALPRDPGQMTRKGGTRSETSRTGVAVLDNHDTR
jgi:hypothetical protein